MIRYQQITFEIRAEINTNNIRSDKRRDSHHARVPVVLHSYLLTNTYPRREQARHHQITTELNHFRVNARLVPELCSLERCSVSLQHDNIPGILHRVARDRVNTTRAGL